MLYVNLEDIRPHIRGLLADLQAAQDAVSAESDRRRRAQLIEDNAQRWTALRDAFEAISDGKCWYTECKSPGAENDIDHFRPKGKVREDRQYPGYYWLASTGGTCG